MTELTFFEASKLPTGTHVRFVREYETGGYFPVVPAGTTGTVTENGLNEMQPMLYIKPDPDHIEMVKAVYRFGGDGDLQLSGPEAPDDAEWHEGAFIEVM